MQETGDLPCGVSRSMVFSLGVPKSVAVGTGHFSFSREQKAPPLPACPRIDAQLLGKRLGQAHLSGYKFLFSLLYLGLRHCRPTLRPPWFIIQKTKFQFPARLGKGYSLVSIWARTTFPHMDFQNPLPVFSPHFPGVTPIFLIQCPLLLFFTGVLQGGPDSFLLVPPDIRCLYLGFLLSAKSFLVPLSTSHLHIL